MQTKQRDVFTTIRTEDSILTTDLLYTTVIMCGSCLGVRLGGECLVGSWVAIDYNSPVGYNVVTP